MDIIEKLKDINLNFTKGGDDIMDIIEKLKDINLNFTIGVKWRDPEYLGLAHVQCAGLIREWRTALLDTIVKKLDTRQSILLTNPAEQLRWIENIENIGVDLQKIVNSLDFEKAQVIFAQFQESFNGIARP